MNRRGRILWTLVTVLVVAGAVVVIDRLTAQEDPAYTYYSSYAAEEADTEKTSPTPVLPPVVAKETAGELCKVPPDGSEVTDRDTGWALDCAQSVDGKKRWYMRLAGHLDIGSPCEWPGKRAVRPNARDMLECRRGAWQFQARAAPGQKCEDALITERLDMLGRTLTCSDGANSRLELPAITPGEFTWWITGMVPETQCDLAEGVYAFAEAGEAEARTRMRCRDGYWTRVK